jgi:hypothetical protein
LRNKEKSLIGIIDEISFRRMAMELNAVHEKFEYSHYNYLFDQFLNIDSSNFSLLLTNNALEEFLSVNYDNSKKLFEFTPVKKSDPILLHSSIYFMSHNYSDSLNVKNIFPNSKFIFTMAACHWLETNQNLRDNWGLEFCYILSISVDLILVQHERMKEVLKSLFSALKFDFLSDKVEIVPRRMSSNVFLSSRNEFKLKLDLDPNSIVMVNAGGPWSWTDIFTLLTYLKEDHLRLKSVKFKFVQLGLIQGDNQLELPWVNKIEEFLKDSPELNDVFVLIKDWKEASTKLDDYLQAADIGFLVSSDSLEAWQAVRQRMFDYIKYGVLILADNNSIFSIDYPKELLFTIIPGRLESYQKFFDFILYNPSALEKYPIDINNFEIASNDLNHFLGSGYKSISNRKVILDMIDIKIKNNINLLNEISIYLSADKLISFDYTHLKFGEIKSIVDDSWSIRKLIKRSFMLFIGKFRLLW